uniref:NP n=1 Tax=Chufflevirus sp. TaxID=2814903 RepID=A0A897ZEN7_9VIRU|nr:NP [Chufflevirus sp.]
MMSGDIAKQKNQCLRTECGLLISHTNAKMSIIILERVNIAANALIAEQAAAARMLLASQALAQCRAENNPYTPGNNPLGLGRQQMYGPDPCLDQERDLASATAEHQAAQQAAQIANAPAQSSTTAAPAVQMSDTWESSELFDPVILNVELEPSLQCMWSPTALEDVMETLAVQMDLEQAGSEVWEEMEIVWQNMVSLIHWDPDSPTKPRKGFVLKPRNSGWMNHWAPE